MPVKILTVCKHGLVRSVGLADVLKLHFEEVDVIPVGYFSNSRETLLQLMEWADFIVVMENRYRFKIPHPEFEGKVITCEVGQDTYGNSHNRALIDTVWHWARTNQQRLGIKEHNRKI